MEKPALPGDVKRRLRLAGLAEAWLKWPWAYGREFAAIPDVLGPDEDVASVFDVHPGEWTTQSGLLFVTDLRLIYITFRWFRRRVASTAFADIAEARLVSAAPHVDLVLEMTSGEILRFRNGRGGMKSFSPLFGILEKQLGARLVGTEHLL